MSRFYLLVGFCIFFMTNGIDAFSPVFNLVALPRARIAEFGNLRVNPFSSPLSQTIVRGSRHAARAATNCRMSLFSFPSKDDEFEAEQTFFPAVDRIIAMMTTPSATFTATFTET